MQILIPGIGLIWFYSEFGWPGILIVLSIVVVLIVINIVINESGKTAEIQASNSIIKKHARELAIKKEQLSYDDGYGIKNTDKWEREKKKFIKNVIRPEYIGDLSDQHISQLIDNSIDLNVAASNIRNSFSTNKTSDSLNKSSQRVGVDYEVACSKVLSSSGWDAKTTKASGDQGADIIADKHGKKVVIQCKNYNQPVGNKAVQEAHAARAFYGASHAVVVSNNTFTTAAKQAANRLGVELIHHSELSDLEKHLKN